MSFQMGFSLMFIGVMIFSYLGTNLWCKYSQAKDTPDKRKIHDSPVTTMGGIVIFCVYWLSILFLTFAFRLVVREQVPIFIASSIVLITGIIDDIYTLNPWQKSIGIFIGASIIYWFTDLKIFSMFAILFGKGVFAEIVGYVVTLLWIYYVTNAFNLIDGLDGLSSGVSIIALSAIAFVSYFFSPNSVFILTHMVVLLIAALLGFLPHNYPPAKIFIGDTGILFIGFLISVFCLMGIQRSSLEAISVPLIILGVPLTDTTVAILRRLLKGQSPVQADRLHMHHKLLQRGNPHSRAVVMMYGICAAYAISAVLMSVVEYTVDRYIVLALIIIGTVLLIDYLNLFDLKKTLLFKTKRDKTDESDWCN